MILGDQPCTQHQWESVFGTSSTTATYLQCALCHATPSSIDEIRAILRHEVRTLLHSERKEP